MEDWLAPASIWQQRAEQRLPVDHATVRSAFFVPKPLRTMQPQLDRTQTEALEKGD